MIIFKKISFYLAVAGIVAVVILMKLMSAPLPDAPHVAEPAVNPYLHAIGASGIVESGDKNVAIGTPEEGIVTDVFVVVGDQVKKGEALYQIDSRALTGQLIHQRAHVHVAQAILARLEDQLSRLTSVTDPRAVSIDDLRTKESDVHVAQTQLEAAMASLGHTQILIDRLTVTAPKGGVILQSTIRPGEYASKSSPTMILGDLEQMQIRADIDEQNASWFNPNSVAVAYPKNNTAMAIPLRFVRVEPYVLPKVSLTGSGGERVDTRVLQVIYAFEQPPLTPLYVGQQVDLFIQRAE